MDDQQIREQFRRTDYLKFHHGLLNIARLLLYHLALVLWFIYAPALYLPFYIVFSLVICLIHQRELSEWIHEASHYNFFPGKKANDALIISLAGIFMANDIKVHRIGHNKHHRMKNFFIPEDPDTRLLVIHSKAHFFQELLKDLTGLTALKMFFDRDNQNQITKKTPFFLPMIAIIHLGVMGALFFQGRLDAYFLYYLTLMTLYPLLNRLRLYGQHVDFKSPSSYFESCISRTIDAGLSDRLFFTSRLMMYHYEHHAFPDLPYRALIKMCHPGSDERYYTKYRMPIFFRLYRSLRRES